MLLGKWMFCSLFRGMFHRFYLNSIANYGSDHQGYADLGVEYRQLYRQKTIIGGYVFGGYTLEPQIMRVYG